MPDEVAAVAAGDGAQQADGNQAGGFNFWTVVKTLASRMIMIYLFSSLMRSFTRPPQTANVTTSDGRTVPAPSTAATNVWYKGMHFDLYMYLSDSSSRFTAFDDPNALFAKAEMLTYGDFSSGIDNDGCYTFTKTLNIVDTPLQKNGSLYLHVFAVAEGNSPDQRNDNYNKKTTIYKVRQLNKYRKKSYRRTSNLLTGETELTPEELEKADSVKYEILSHWHPNLTLNIVEDYTAWTRGAIPAPLNEFVDFNVAGTTYRPIFFFNDYWNLVSEMMPLNDTVKEVNLTITYQPIGLFKFQMYASQTVKNKWMSMAMMEDEDDNQDAFKQALLETNPILLATTMIVSLLHTVFEFLAFKNDIQFWRSRKSLEGLSVRSVMFGVFTSLIVLLYVLDNDTNFVIKISVFVGLLIELWKIPKCMDVSIDYERKWLGVIPRLVIKDKGTYVESSTKEYDEMAFRYLSWALYPLLACYAVYSLVYQEHRGWYSWTLSMLYGFLLTFGFIMMTPQLFINYKLKSVAHLPWRMLTYKFINTFIDDLFAFVIRMPLLYRLGCFRDDIVFLIYLYQRWIYRVDMKRVNEFGVRGDGQVEDDAQQEAIANGSVTTVSDEQATPSEEESVRRRRKERTKTKSGGSDRASDGDNANEASPHAEVNKNE